MVDLIYLARRLETPRSNTRLNRLDVNCEIALFVPDERSRAIRANSAGTKVIYTNSDGSETTCWAYHWSAEENRRATAAKLRRLAAEKENR